MEPTPEPPPPRTPPKAIPAADPAMPTLDPARTLEVLGTPLRWQLLQRGAASGPVSAFELAAAFKLKFNNVSKHLRILRDAGLLETSLGEDKRFVLYSIPEIFKRDGGQWDFGFCVFRAPGGGKVG